jgi:hypothetical protein
MPSTTDSRPPTLEVLSHLKDFQRTTVEYVFRRLYLDGDCVRRFLIADEVGLGKTLVARGVIAKVIDHLWDRGQRIDIVYVCSNTDIARQNINRLNISCAEEFTPPGRITLLPIHVQGLHSRLNLISFTPRTSLDLRNNPGKSTERELLYHLLAGPWSLSFNSATRVLEGSAGTDGFRERVRRFFDWYAIQPEIASAFARNVKGRDDLRQRFAELSEEMPRAGASVPWEVHRKRNRLIGDLRKVLAQTCLHWLKPDLVILDEFQRFKHLLQGDSEEMPEASELAHHLFNYQACQGDPATAARVLLLSATPYKMYTLSQETEQDDHYQDFRSTLHFLLPGNEQRQLLHGRLTEYREELFRLADLGHEGLARAKNDLESALRSVMVRTERLALSADRNGMLTEVPPPEMPVTPGDVEQYLALQRIARAVGHEDILEYWKSAPYLLNFMDDYDLKRKFASAAADATEAPALAEAIASAPSGWLDRLDLERYRSLDPSNARLRCLSRDTIERGACRLLWIPPSLPYYQGQGPFSEPQLQGFTKRLVFSCWRVVPKAVASVLSYEAERLMIRSFRKGARNTAEARKKRRPLLRFTFRKGRPTGMPALALIYPCKTLADRFDPLALAAPSLQSGVTRTLPDLLGQIAAQMSALLAPIVGSRAEGGGPVDEAWYWAAPLLLDLATDREATVRWFAQPDLDRRWAGKTSLAEEAAVGWSRHVAAAREIVTGRGTLANLGPAPADLAETLALLAVAGSGVVALRALGRIAPAQPEEQNDLRHAAGSLAHAFLHLFNLPEVMALVRDRHKVVPYWRSVLDYCAAGNLQSVMDEYGHVLVESLGLLGKTPDVIAAEVSREIQRSLTLRTATAQADLFRAVKRRVRTEEPIRMRARFAMRFGDQEAEESAEPTPADQVRSAFNSPFWPFVLATTSVGQEGLDFHTYCHAVVHWNLPSNPVDLEQREGRVHRYKGHALRRNVASGFAAVAGSGTRDPWAAMFKAAQQSRAPGQNDLFPFWVVPSGPAKIERHVLLHPYSREALRHENLRRSLVLYRMVFGQNRQEDLVAYLAARLPVEAVSRLLDLCRVDLSPPQASLPVIDWCESPS